MAALAEAPERAMSCCQGLGFGCVHLFVLHGKWLQPDKVGSNISQGLTAPDQQVGLNTAWSTHGQHMVKPLWSLPHQLDTSCEEPQLKAHLPTPENPPLPCPVAPPL